MNDRFIVNRGVEPSRLRVPDDAPPASASETARVGPNSDGANAGAPETSERCATHGIHRHIGCGVAAPPRATAAELTREEFDALRLPWHAPGLDELHDANHDCVADGVFGATEMDDKRAALVAAALNKLPVLRARADAAEKTLKKTEEVVFAQAATITKAEAAISSVIEEYNAAEPRATYHEHLVEQERAERQRLERIIEEAPHGDSCACDRFTRECTELWRIWNAGPRAGARPSSEYQPCDCWHAQAAQPPASAKVKP
jgi:hypothetical protein